MLVAHSDTTGHDLDGHYGNAERSSEVHLGVVRSQFMRFWMLSTKRVDNDGNKLGSSGGAVVLSPACHFCTKYKR